MTEVFTQRAQRLIIFRPLLENKIIRAALNAGDSTEKSAELSHLVLSGGGNLTECVKNILLDDDNPVIRSYANGEKISAALCAQLSYELDLFDELAHLECMFPVIYSWETSEESVKELYLRHCDRATVEGFGVFCRYHMFNLDDDGTIRPVLLPDPQRLSQLVGYENEREKIITNTLALIYGRAHNNVLLYGDAGTGKSSTIKALANEYKDLGLRLVEVKKNQMRLIPSLLEALGSNPLKFIIFIDDLTFDPSDGDFNVLKAILEGAVSARGENTAIYVTSNHRHLVKESSDDRTGDSLHVEDRIQEVISLSARFGLSITFLKPDKKVYADIVMSYAAQMNVEMDSEELIRRAEAYAIRSGGRNPRTAKQFVKYIASGQM